MRFRSVSEEELEIITSQLGRTPRGVKGVVKICSRGRPMVIVTAPVLPDGDLFPTCFWLTCPLLSKEVGRLESEGQIKVLQYILKSNKKLSAKMKRAHRDCQILRRSLISKIGSQKFSPSEKGIVEKTGVAGVLDLTKVKCLHAHYAQFLAAGNNPIGEIIHKKLEKLECERACPCPPSAVASGAGRRAPSCGSASLPSFRVSELAGSRRECG